MPCTDWVTKVKRYDCLACSELACFCYIFSSDQPFCQSCPSWLGGLFICRCYCPNDLPLSQLSKRRNTTAILQKLNQLTHSNLRKAFHIPAMCLLPCWPFNDVYLEEPRRKNNTEEGVLVYDPNAKSVVKIAGSLPVSPFTFCFHF